MTELRDNRVLLALTSYNGLIPALTTASLFNLRRPCHIGFLMVTGHLINTTRNVAVQQMLAGDWTHLFFVDDDNPFPRDTLEKFLEADKDIVSAPIVTRRPNAEGKHELCAFYAEWHGDVQGLNRIVAFRDEGYLQKVDACGMACTLIKRKVLETVSEQYHQQAFEWTTFLLNDPIKRRGKLISRQVAGEDCAFCMRATDAGFEVWLDTRIRPLHLGDPTRYQWNPDIEPL